MNETKAVLRHVVCMVDIDTVDRWNNDYKDEVLLPTKSLKRMENDYIG